jgi:DNA-binding response OmpR family regulator
VTTATPVHVSSRWPAHGPVGVLLVLDQPMVERLTRLTLNHGVYDTRVAQDGIQAMRVLAAWQPHLMLLDTQLEISTIMARLRRPEAGEPKVPVIGLTRRGDLNGKLAALEAGVDDILTVPFAPEELVARVIALVRRSYREAVTFTPAINVGELQIDILNRTVNAGASELHLTSSEQSLLYLLASNAGRVVTPREIANALWGAEYVDGTHAVDMQVRSLRARLQNVWREQRFIDWVPGRGYRFLPTFTSAADAA